MSNYGFNPDELVDTKVELIDKDGFHKVGEVSDGGNGGGESEGTDDSLKEGIYFSKSFSSGNDKAVNCLMIKTKDSPSDLDTIYTMNRVFVYYGDTAISDSEITIENEEMRPIYDRSNEIPYQSIGNSYCTFINRNDSIAMIVTDITYSSIRSISAGTEMHIIVVYRTTAEENEFFQLHTTMPEIDWGSN